MERSRAATAGCVLRRLMLCSAALIAAGRAGWVNPRAPARLPPQAGARGAFAPPGAASPLAVTRWSLGSARGNAGSSTAAARRPAGRPFYIRLRLRGGAAAIAALRANGRLPIVVRWTPQRAGAVPAAPPLTTELSIGRPDLTDRLAAEVRRTGYFVWRTWARKDTLSPGRWTVSLTYPDGRPLPCGPQKTPCRFSFEIG